MKSSFLSGSYFSLLSVTLFFEKNISRTVWLHVRVKDESELIFKVIRLGSKKDGITMKRNREFKRVGLGQYEALINLS